MLTLFRLALGFVVIVTGGLGLAFMVQPEIAAARLGIGVLRVEGLSTVRGDLGGAFLALSGWTLYGAIRRRPLALLPPLTILFMVLLGRLVSAAIDGSGSAALQFIVPEVLMVVILAVSYLMISRVPPARGV